MDRARCRHRVAPLSNTPVAGCSLMRREVSRAPATTAHRLRARRDPWRGQRSSPSSGRRRVSCRSPSISTTDTSTSVRGPIRRSSPPPEHAMSSWNTLVTAALLGTDRRDPPPPPPGPIADAVADLALVVGDDSADVRLLNQVAVTTLARRAASRPGPPVARLVPPPSDPRHPCPPAAARVVAADHHPVAGARGRVAGARLAAPRVPAR